MSPSRTYFMMLKRQLRLLAILLLAALLLVAPVFGCQQPQPTMPPPELVKHEPAEGTLAIEIKNPSDGAKLNRNLENVIGYVSDPRAMVTVNGREAEVEEPDWFSAIVELEEGENIIEAVATLGKQKVSTAITVTYELELALGLDVPQLRLGEDYTESPIEVTGHVSDSRARVTVNGKEVEIGKVYGRFSTMVDLTEGENIIEAVATLGEDEVRETKTAVFRPKAPLSLDVKSPGDGAELNIDFIKVSGSVSDPEDVVMVNGTEGQVAGDATFYAYVELMEGENIIEAVAVRGEERFSETIGVTYSPPRSGLITDALSLGISSPEDGAELKVNLQKVTGTVTDPEATLVVNGIEAKVAEDGTYYAYIELTDGENSIEAVAIRDMAKSSETITVRFSPALVVRLDYPDFLELNRRGIDFTQTPLIVTGTVNNPEAEVTITRTHLEQEIEVEVANDGSFSTQVELRVIYNKIEAVAKLGDEEDRDSFEIRLLPEGRLEKLYRRSLAPPQAVVLDDSIVLKAGETKILDATLWAEKREPFEFTCIIRRAAGTYSEARLLPMPEGMKLSIEPTKFTAYPRTAYHFSIIIETTHQLAPGIYYLRYVCYFAEGVGGRQGGWITVDVE